MDSSVVTLHSQIARVMDALVKAAVVEINKLLVKQDPAVLRLELKHKELEIQNLLKRLKNAEGELNRITSTRTSAASAKNSVAVQVELSKDAFKYEGSSLQENQFFEEGPMQLLPFQEFHEEDLEFEVKIEQVEDPKEEKCSQTEQDGINSACLANVGSSQLYRATSVANVQNVYQQDFGEPDYTVGLEQSRNDFLAHAEQYAAAHVLLQDGSCSLPNMNLCSTVPAKGISDGQELSGTREPYQAHYRKRQATIMKQKQHKASLVNKGKWRHAQSLSEPEVHKQNPARFKRHHCRECGKLFSQKNRLISHQWVHTGKRPFCCRICGQVFSRQDNCQRHERLHNNQ